MDWKAKNNLDDLDRYLDRATYGVSDPSENISNPIAAGFLKQTSYTMDSLHNWLEQVRRLSPSPLEGEGGGEGDRVTRFVPNEVNAYESSTTQMGGGSETMIHYIYDANGNLTDDGIYQYSYDYRNFVTEVHNRQDGSLVASYSYDALGRRIAKRLASGIETKFIYDGIHIIEEYEADAVSAKYTHGVYLDQPLTMEKGDETYFYHTDTLGNVVVLTNGAGEIVERYKYDAYGEVEIYDAGGALMEESAAGNRFLFTGREYDAEAQLYYYRLRTYNPRLGRFLQQDPLGYIDSLNAYAYVVNNPVNYLDPLGLQTINGNGNARAGNPNGNFDVSGRVGPHDILQATNFQTPNWVENQILRGVNNVNGIIATTVNAIVDWQSIPSDIVTNAVVNYQEVFEGSRIGVGTGGSIKADLIILKGELSIHSIHGNQISLNGLIPFQEDMAKGKASFLKDIWGISFELNGNEGIKGALEIKKGPFTIENFSKIKLGGTVPVFGIGGAASINLEINVHLNKLLNVR